MCGTTCTFVVDTGADISIFKKSKISKEQYFYPNRKCVIQGITDTKMQSIGTTYTNIHFSNECKIEHAFQIVEDNVLIEADGILGLDFLTKTKANLDYDTWTLTINTQNKVTEVPILSAPYANLLTIPPRCEVARRIEINQDKNIDVVIENQEIKPGVFIAGTITNLAEPIIKILNTTNKLVTLDKYQVSYEPLTDFTITPTTAKTTNREEHVLNKINLQQIPPYAESQFKELCREYADIFALEDEILTTNNFYSQSIELSDNIPVYTKNYRIPETHKNEIDKQVRKMLQDGIIENSVSHFNSPILLVPKKSTTEKKKWRLVVDFRSLNKKVLADKFPLPRIEDILDQMGRAKYFSTLDLMSGFHQIPLEKSSRKYTAFSTEKGHYQYTRLPFGLNISPNSFQRMMAIAMAGLTPEVAFLYIDDIIVIGCSQSHHLKNLTIVFKRLRERNLKLNPEKCQFFQTEVIYLGHKISVEGVSPDPSKYEAIKNYPTPKNADEIRRFVAFCNYYRRFVPNFAEIAQPLNKLLKKKAKFDWTENQQYAFEKLRKTLMSPTVLQHPDFTQRFIISTDASNVACGAILSQNINGIERPIAYASKTFTPGEANKSTIEKELTAIHWAITYFKPYVYGRKFTVRTDHRPLAYLFGMKNPTSKLTRMRLDLEEFDFEIKYVKGKENSGPDALSRIQIDISDLKEIKVLQMKTRAMKQREKQEAIDEKTSINEVPQPDQLRVTEELSETEITNVPELFIEVKNCRKRIDLEINIVHNNIKIFRRSINNRTNQSTVETALEQAFEELEQYLSKTIQTKTLKLSAESEIFKLIDKTSFKALGNKKLKVIRIEIYKPMKYITNKEHIEEILHNFHAAPTGGHLGQSRMLSKIKQFYKWRRMKNTIAAYIKRCELCAKNKHQKNNKEIMEITTTPAKPFGVVSIDTVGPFSRTENGNRYAVTMQCDLTKYVVALPVKDKEANTIAKAIVTGFILTYGPMEQIKSDLGTEYKNQIFAEVCNTLKIKQIFATAAHPETVGALERNHKCLNEYLRCFVNENRDDWDTWIPYYAFCYNTTPNTVHGYTPFELIFAKKISLPAELENRGIEPIYNYELYNSEMKFRLQKALKKAKENLETAKDIRQQNSKLDCNPLSIKVGDKVLVTIQNRKKLDSLYSGPYLVKALETVNCILEDANKKVIRVHKNRVRKM